MTSVGAAARRFLQLTPVPAVLVDADAVIRTANADAEAMLGYPPGGLDGLSSVDLVHPEHRDRAREHFAAAVAGRTPKGLHVQLPIRRGDGPGWTEIDVATTGLLDDPSMAGILLTALPTAPTDAHASGC